MGLQQEFGKPLEVTAAIKTLTEIIMSHGIQYVVSEITYRDDDLWRKAKEVNRMMRNDLQSDVKIIDNTNISGKHLNSSSLHLNQRGSGALALNYITYIRSIDLRVLSLSLLHKMKNMMVFAASKQNLTNTNMAMGYC